ncbi:MAG: pyridoxal phosphate-dependent aminotransferase [Candidatus Aminicenantes bacterium]|nr:pyridoxal phosphate-dependent aminotransferase [Candidatus Aminicenantes bacterium]
MDYDFDTIIDRHGTSSSKWDRREKAVGVPDVVPMWVADMDFASPPPVVEALRERVDHGIFGYTERTGSYYAALASWMQRRFDWDIQKKKIVFTPGVIVALNLIIQAYTQPGDKVIIQQPVYHPFSYAILNNKRQLFNNQLQIQNGRYVMDLDQLKKSIDSRTRLLILCSPHNPVGRVWTKEELLRLAEICLDNNIIIVSDEIHADLVLKGQVHTPTATLSEEIADIVVTCTAPTKTFNIAGLGVANTIISNSKLYDQFYATVNNAGLEMTNVFAKIATEAAYNHGEEWLLRLLDYLQGNYKFLVSFLKNHIPQISVFPLEGTYLAWLDFRKLGLSDKDMKHFLIHKAKVWLDEGTKFGGGGEGFQRMNIGCPRKLLEEGLTRIANALKEL